MQDGSVSQVGLAWDWSQAGPDGTAGLITNTDPHTDILVIQQIITTPLQDVQSMCQPNYNIWSRRGECHKTATNYENQPWEQAEILTLPFFLSVQFLSLPLCQLLLLFFSIIAQFFHSQICSVFPALDECRLLLLPGSDTTAQGQKRYPFQASHPRRQLQMTLKLYKYSLILECNTLVRLLMVKEIQHSL